MVPVSWCVQSWAFKPRPLVTGAVLGGRETSNGQWPWENGYNERFNGTLRREGLNAEWFTSIKQAQTVIETWQKQYNRIRPHQALNISPRVPETLSGNGT